MRGCPWAWTETFTSLTRWRRTAGEITAASLHSREYEPSFRRLPCLSLSRQVGVTRASSPSLERSRLGVMQTLISNMFTDVHIHSDTSKAIQVSRCLLSVHLLGFTWWFFKILVVDCYVCDVSILSSCSLFFFLLICFLSHPPPFQKKVTWVLKLVSLKVLRVKHPCALINF